MPMAAAMRPRSRRDGAHDYAARDTRARVPVRLAHIVVGAGIHDDRRAVAVEDRLLAVAQREGVADRGGVQRAVARRELVGQVARMDAVLGEIAVHLLGVVAEMRTGR